MLVNRKELEFFGGGEWGKRRRAGGEKEEKTGDKTKPSTRQGRIFLLEANQAIRLCQGGDWA